PQLDPVCQCLRFVRPLAVGGTKLEPLVVQVIVAAPANQASWQGGAITQQEPSLKGPRSGREWIEERTAACLHQQRSRRAGGVPLCKVTGRISGGHRGPFHQALDVGTAIGVQLNLQASASRGQKPLLQA